MQFRFVPALCASLVILVSAVAARADEIQFTNGDKLTGKVVTLKDGSLAFASAVAGTVALKWSDVATLSTDEPVTLQLEGGSMIVDKLVASESGTVKTAGSDKVTSQTIPLATAQKLNPEPVQWKGNVVAGVNIERGNTMKTAGNLDIGAVRRSENDRIRFGAGYAAEESQDSDETGQHATESKMHGELQYDYFFTKRFYLWGNAGGEKDRFADLALRFTAGTGVGYQWFETDTFKWGTEVGLSWLSENFTDETPRNDRIALRLASNLEYVLYPGLAFFQKTEWFPSLESRKDQLVRTGTGLRYKLFGNFFGESKVLWTWDSSPAEGKKRNDVSYLLGLGYSF